MEKSAKAISISVFLAINTAARARIKFLLPKQSSGTLPSHLKIEDLKKPHASHPTNTLLATVMFFADYIQQAGSGTLEMLKQCKAKGLPEPDFVSVRNLEFKTILARDIYTEEALNRLGLNERQLKAVKYVKEKGKITNKEYQELTGVSKPTATRELSKLVGARVLDQKGIVGKGTFYILKRANGS